MSLFDEIRKNVTDLTENVAKKSSTVIETQKMRMRKTSLESDLRDYYVQLGKLYEKRLAKSEETEEDAAPILDKIEGAKKEIRSIQEALIKARGMVRCTACGQDVSREFDFCPKCGAKLEKPEPEPEKEVISPDDITVEGEGESKVENVGADIVKEAADAAETAQEAADAAGTDQEAADAAGTDQETADAAGTTQEAANDAETAPEAADGAKTEVDGDDVSPTAEV